MANLKEKRRLSVIAEIKRVYNEETMSYNLTLKDIGSYIRSYINIATMLEFLKINQEEVKIIFGKELTTWFFKTHDNIIAGFWTDTI